MIPTAVGPSSTPRELGSIHFGARFWPIQFPQPTTDFILPDRGHWHHSATPSHHAEAKGSG